MRLSDVQGERCLEVVALCIGPIAAIAQDEAAKELFGGARDKAELAAKALRCLPGLIERHKGEVVAVMAAVEGVSPEEYAASLTMPKLLKDAIELVTDEALLAFLS